MNLLTHGFSAVIGLLVYLVFLLALFLLLRSFMLWYWKINVIVKNQEQQTKLMEEQRDLLAKLLQQSSKN